MQAVGRMLSGAKGDELARGVGVGFLKASLVTLHSAYRQIDLEARRR